MRAADPTSYRNLLNSLNMLNERLEKAAQELSTGKRITRPQDSPSECAEAVQLQSRLDRIDQYRSNADNSGFFLQVTESSLNCVHNLLTTVYTRGSAAATNVNAADVRQTLATEIRALRDEILSLANTEVRGRFLFSGSRVTTPAFEIAGDTVSYLGDETVNSVRVAAGVEVQTNIPGAAVFADAFSDVEQLLAAVEGGDTADIQAALERFDATFASLGRVRTRLGVDLSRLQESEVQLQVQETNIQTRKAHIEDANLAEAITRLNTTQTALQATLQAGSLIRQLNLFDYLG